MAAAKFSKEANLQPQQENTSIKARQQIQEHIHKGHIKQAVEALNDLDPEVSNHLSIAFPSQTPSILFAMIRTRVYMHHAYGLLASDDKQPPFS